MDIADLSTPDFNLQKFVSNSQEKTEWKKASPLKTYSKKITPPSAEKADGKSRYGRVHKPRLSMDYLSTDKKVSQYLKVDVDNQMHYFKASPYAIQKPAPKTPSTPGTPRRGRPPKVSMVKPPDRVQMALHEVLDKVKAMNSSDNLNDLQAPVPTSTETIEIPTHLFIPKEEQLSDSEEVINEGDWNVGDLAWACVGGFPYWPCAVTKDPEDNKYKKLKALGKNRFQKEFIHVRFFGDKGRRSWIMTSHVIPFHGLDSFQSLAEETLTPTVKRKDPKLFRSFTIPPSLRKTWQAAVSEAESLQEAPRFEENVTLEQNKKRSHKKKEDLLKKKKKKKNHERITYFLNMFPPTPPSEKKVEVKPEPKKRGRKRKTELLAVSPSPEIKKIKTEPEEEAFISPSTSNISKVFQPSTPNGLDYQPLIKVKEEPVTPTSSSIKEAKTTQITSSAVNQIKEETPSLPVKVPGKKGRPPGRRKKSDDFDFTPLKRKYTKKSSLDQRLKENRMKKRNEEKKAATKDKKFKDPAYEMFYDKTFDRVSAENPSLSDEDIEKFIEKMWHEVKDQKPIGFRSREGAEMAEMTCNDSKSDSSSRSNSPPPITVPSSKTPYKRGISLFAGIRSDKVCQVCFKNSEEGEVLKCRGPCGQPLHLHCEDKPRYQPYVFKKEPQEEAVVEKKKRGRPRSVNLTPNKSPETNCVEIKTEPKIEVVHSQDGLPFLPTILPNTNVVLSPDTPMKRKRGRPRKYPLVPSPTKVSECKYISNTQEQFISNNLNSSSQPSIVNFNSQGPENGCMPDSPSFVPDQCVNAHNKENDENYVCIGFTDEPRERYEKLLFLKRKLLLEGIFDDRSDISERTLPVLSQLKHNSRDFVDSDNNNRTVKESQKSVSKGIKSLEETKKPDNHDIMDLSLELNSSGDSVIIKDTDNINEEYSCESKNELTENFLEKNMNKEVQDSMTDISSATSEVDKEARSFKTSSNEFTSLNETDNINITEPNESANETMKMNYTESDQSVSNETNTESIIDNSSVANEYNLAETVSSEISRSIFDSTEDETNVINTSCKSDIQKTLEHIDSDEEAVLGTEAPVSEEEYLPKAETNQSIEEEVQKGESSFKQTEASNKEQIENNNVKRTDRGKDVSECSSKSDEIEDNISIENTRKSNLKLLGTLRGDSFESESSNNNLIVDDSSTDNRLEINDTAPDSQSATMDCSETKSAVLSILSGDSQTSDKITRFEDVDYGGLNKGSGVIDSNNPVTVSLDMPDLDFSENDDTIMSNPVDKKEITTKEDNCEVDNQSKSEESSSVLTSKSILLNLRDQITFAENVLNKDMALPQEKSSLCNSNVENNSASSFGDNGSLPTDKLLESCNSIQGDSRIESSAPEPRDGPVSSLDHSSVNIPQTIKKLCEESPAPSIIRHQSTEESLDHSSNHSSVNISHAIKTLSEESPAPSVIRHQSTEESLDHSSVNISHTIKTLSEESPAPSLIRHQSTEESLDHSSNSSSENISHAIKTLSEESPAPSITRHQSTEESLDHSSNHSSVNISHTIKTLSEESPAPSVIRHQSTEESLDHSSVNISHTIKTLSEESPAPSLIRHQSTEESLDHSSNSSSENISHAIKTLSEESPAPSVIHHQSTEESLDHSSINSSVNISHTIKTLSEESSAPSVIRHQSTEESLDHSSNNSSVNISHVIKTLSEESPAPSVIRHQSTEESLDHSSNNSSVNISHVIKTLSEESPAPSVIRHQSTEEPQSHIEEEEEEEECFEVKKEEKEVRKFSKPIRHKSVDLALGDLKSKEENGNTLKKGGDSNGEKGKNKTFLCSLCNEGKSGPCFICGKEGEERIRCGYCGKVYHLKCAKEWPQSQISETAKGRLLFHCPQHMCHTCVSDNPSACSARFNNDRLVRCVMCPATYHYGNYCVPAGSEVLSLTQLICPRHYTPQRKGLHHVNASWCFLCSMGGTLLCCDLCPNSFHADCLKISPPEGSFICEDCDTGRYPLFGEIVWVKLGTYRWWPARILFPQEVPENINQLPHSRGEFAVEFFGSHDYYWVNRGRVFLYHDGDGCKIVSKTRVDELFTRGVHEASAAFVKWTEERASREATSRISMKPPKYVKIQSNRIVGNVNKNIDSKENVAQTCECDPAKPNPCGPDSDCINRLLSVECDPEVCPAGENCCNQNFEKRNYPRLVPFKTESRGWGLKTVDAIKKGTFIIEYVGEMIDEEEYQKRLSNMVKNKDENFYFLTLDKDRMLDAGPKGNVARFMNHSCDPNCETQKWTVNGDTRVGLFALEDIKPDTELVFNYNLATVGDTKVECKCGAANCAGFIGAKNSSKPGHSRHSKLQTPTAADEKKIGMKKKKRKQSKALKLSEETCFTCGNGGELLLCDDASCPKAYHLSCLGLTKHPAGGWVCPWHQCSVCSATKVQRCTLCINSYCADHAEGNISLNRTHGLLCFSHNPSDSGSDWSDDRGNLSDEEDLAKTKQQASRKNSQSRIVNGHVD